MAALIAIIFLTLIASVLALIGGVVFLFVKPWSRTLALYSVPFAAGVLLTVALIGLLPEAVHVIDQKAFLIALITFLAAYLFENIACDLHHHHETSQKGVDYCGATWLVILGDTIHNFIDGATIAATFLANPGLGIITTASTFLHEVPHEIGDFGILLKAGWKRGKILLVNIISALFTVVGGLAVFFLFSQEIILGYLLAAAAGLFLYLGASDFLPHAGEDISRQKAIIVLLIGVLMMWFTFQAIPHSHQESDQPESIHDELAASEALL